MWEVAALAFSAGTSFLGAMNSANSSIKAANAVSRREGEAIVKERLATSIRNSYSTAFSQMQLALQKRQSAQQIGDIDAATLAARGTVEANVAATGSMGGSVQAVISDINHKSEQAKGVVLDNYANAVDQHNYDLDMMVVNTRMTEPTMKDYKYTGPSTGQMFAGAILGAAGQYAASYASSLATLGLGPKANPGISPGISYVPKVGVQINSDPWSKLRY